MRTRVSQVLAAALVSMATLAAADAGGLGLGVPSPDTPAPPATSKTLASGLYLSGYSASFGTNYSSVTVTVTELHNDSFTRTTGTLKIEYWAALSPPARAASFTGYRLATFNAIAALPPRTYYSDLVRTSPMVVPPDGTYTFVLILLEYDPANCTAADGYCLVDSLIGSQRTFGNAPSSYSLGVSLAGTGTGSVTSSPAGLNCPGTCSASFPAGSTVTLAATPSPGSTFAGWGGNCAGTGACAVTMAAAGSVTATFNAAAAAASNYSDIWWNPAESGWGITIADHQTQLFAVWYTYRQNGSPTWFVIPGGTFSQGRRFFSGDIYQTTGPPYTTTFDPGRVVVTKVGSASFDFAPPGLAAGTALFSYSVGPVSGSKQIERQPFGSAPPDWGGDLTDIYWDPAESGWGLTIAQHGNNVFAVWFTYDTAGQPIFVIMPGATFTGPLSFSGDQYTTTGPYFGNSFFDSSQVRVNKVGTGTVDLDPGLASAASAKSTCNRRTGCRPSGRYRPCLNGTCYGKWISPQGFGYAAPDTLPPACEILYDEWSPCVNGSQSRHERVRQPAGCSGTPELVRSCEPPQPCIYNYDRGACQPGNFRNLTVVSASPAGCTGAPQATEACTYSSSACTYTYGEYGACVNGIQSRVVLGASPPGCTGTPVTTRPCTAACTYTYGEYGTCINGIQTRSVLGASPAGCTGTPLTTRACTNTNLPPGFPTNLPLGLYRLDVTVCATLVGCFSSSQTLTNADAATFASQITSILNSSAPPSAGCSQSTSYSAFDGISFTATLNTVCSSGSASASSTVTIRVTRI